MLSDRQQKMLIKMTDGGITKNTQSLYLSPFFYTQMSALVKKGLVKTEWNHARNNVIYHLSDDGMKLALMLAKLFEEVLHEI